MASCIPNAPHHASAALLPVTPPCHMPARCPVSMSCVMSASPFCVVPPSYLLPSYCHRTTGTDKSGGGRNKKRKWRLTDIPTDVVMLLPVVSPSCCMSRIAAVVQPPIALRPVTQRCIVARCVVVAAMCRVAAIAVPPIALPSCLLPIIPPLTACAGAVLKVLPT